MKEEIKKIVLESVVKNFGQIELPEFSIEKPKEAMHGDYSTSVALVLAKKLGKNPLEVAKMIVAQINHSNILENIRIGKVEAVAPGFVNFYLADNVFGENIQRVLKQGADFGRFGRYESWGQD